MNVDYKILCLEFDNLTKMRNALEASAIKYEGVLNNRVGYNFPVSYLIDKSIPELKPHHEYVIAYVKGDHKTSFHEMCHARFYCDESYRKTWTKKWNMLNPRVRQKIIKKLSYIGYPESVWIDEYQAYFQERASIVSFVRSKK